MRSSNHRIAGRKNIAIFRVLARSFQSSFSFPNPFLKRPVGRNNPSFSAFKSPTNSTLAICSETSRVRSLLAVVFCQPPSFQDMCSTIGPSGDGGKTETQNALLVGSTATSRGSPDSRIVARNLNPKDDSQLKENRAGTLPTIS